MRLFPLIALTAPIAMATADIAGAGGTRPVAEIVTFKLTAGTDPAAFARAAEGMTPFLEETGAVVSRTLSRRDDGVWTDHIVWTSLEAAQTAAQNIMQNPGAMPFMSMIDDASVSLSHAPILFRQE